jgi:hypothetical protein
MADAGEGDEEEDTAVDTTVEAVGIIAVAKVHRLRAQKATPHSSRVTPMA